MAARIAGTSYIKVDGQQLEISGGHEVPLMSVKREAVMGVAGVSGVKEVAIKPSTKIKANVPRNFPVELLRSATDMTVTSELANGMVYTVAGAWVEGEPMINSEDGTIDLEFGGMRGFFQ